MKTLKLNTKILLILFAIFTTTTAVPQWHKAADGREYLIETDLKYNWHQAWHECARRDAQLVAIESSEKNHALIELLKAVVGKSHNLWLGGNDEYSTSRDYGRPFYWSATGKPLSYAYWSDKNPDNYKNQEHCVHIWDAKPLYEWNDNDCNVKMGFICETNHYLQTYNNNLKHKCEAFKVANLKMSKEFDQLQNKQVVELNNLIESRNKSADALKFEMEKLQKATQSAVEQILQNHEKNVQEMNENMLKQVQDFNEQIKRSAHNLNVLFVEKLKVNQEEIKEIC